MKIPLYIKEYISFTDDAEAAQEYGVRYAAATRRWSNSIYFDGLSESRSEEERMAIVDEFYTRLGAYIGASPDDHRYDLVYMYIHIAKKA